MDKMHNQSNIIEAKGVFKSFPLGLKTLDVLKNLKFSVETGEFVSIMGPSGCGKSTLLYLLGGLDIPTKGEVIFNSRSYNTMKEKEMSVVRRRDIGFVFQFYNLVQNLNVEDNILLPLLLDGRKPKNFEKDLKKILDIIGLDNWRKHTPRELSGGQQQRVAIARALLFDPKLILADEPIGNLDSKSGEEIMNLFKTINKEFKKTIIQVTHSDESASYGSRIINMRDGIIEKDSYLKTS